MATWHTITVSSELMLKDCGKSLLFKVADGRTFFHPKKLCHEVYLGYEIVYSDSWVWRLSSKIPGSKSYRTEEVDDGELVRALNSGPVTIHHIPEHLEPEACEPLEELIDDGTD